MRIFSYEELDELGEGLIRQYLGKEAEHTCCVDIEGFVMCPPAAEIRRGVARQWRLKIYILSWKLRLMTSNWCSRLSLVKFTA